MATATESVPIRFTGWKRPGSVPRWAQAFNSGRATVSEITNADADDLTGIIIIGASSPARFRQHRAGIRRLGKRLAGARGPFKVIVSLGGPASPDPEALAAVLRLFPPPVARHIEFALGAENLEPSLRGALAKYSLLEEEHAPDPLAEAKEVLKATRRLLAPSGRLSAKAIAGAFGMSLSTLAQQIGRSRQSVTKTPDAPKIQPLLRPYERIARLRSVFTDAEFKAWLERPNPLLEARSPKELVGDGRADTVADLAEDMLLGAPS